MELVSDYDNPNKNTPPNTMLSSLHVTELGRTPPGGVEKVLLEGCRW